MTIYKPYTYLMVNGFGIDNIESVRLYGGTHTARD
jgi:hypothetical protein